MHLCDITFVETNLVSKTARINQSLRRDKSVWAGFLQLQANYNVDGEVE